MAGLNLNALAQLSQTTEIEMGELSGLEAHSGQFRIFNSTISYTFTKVLRT